MTDARKIFSIFAQELGRMREAEGTASREQVAAIASVSYSTVKRFEEGECDSLPVLAAEIQVLHWPGKWRALEHLFEQMSNANKKEEIEMTKEEKSEMARKIRETAQKMMQKVEQMSDEELKSIIGAGPYKGWTMDAFITDALMRMRDHLDELEEEVE